MAVTELVLKMPISTFYSIMGVSVGETNIVTAAFVGFGLHLLTGTALGAILGATGIRWKKLLTYSLWRNVLMGMSAVFVIWLALFLPITFLLIQPSIQRVVLILALEKQQITISSEIEKSITNISVGALLFHLIWGVIFSLIMRFLIQTKKFAKQDDALHDPPK
jgi:hypothetical protein